MRERCPHCSKALNGSGECLNCGKSYPAMVGTPMTRGEVKDLVRRHRLMSGSCKSRRHDECKVSTCECWHHNPEARQRYAEHLRREANELEHRSAHRNTGHTRDEMLERAEELRSRADDWYEDGGS